MRITVEDERCPDCGGHAVDPDDEDFYGNSPEVCDADGTWWWECNNPDCDVAMYNPEKEVIETLTDDGYRHVSYDDWK